MQRLRSKIKALVLGKRLHQEKNDYLDLKLIENARVFNKKPHHKAVPSSTTENRGRWRFF